VGNPGDTTSDWLLPEASRPPLIGELEQRVEQALATARASEDAVMTVGAAAIDAAEQARRAAELAEKASISARDAQERVAAVVAARRTLGGSIEVGDEERSSEAEGEDSLSDFSARADRLVARLRRLQRVPLPAPPTSGFAAQPRSAH
jgi:multidrug resistance efflux pump